MQSGISVEDTRELVDKCISDLLKQRVITAGDVGQSYARFWRYIEKIVFAGGKRIRPYLTMVGNGSVDARVIPVAAAQELVHCAMLIHDDVIDQDFARRGEKNINGIYRDVYGEEVVASSATHYANSAAILAGDALLSEAYYLINSSDYDESTRQKIIAQLHRSIFEVIGGELLDVEAGFVRSEQFEPMQIYRYKTSSYSFIGPLLSGAYCAGADQYTLDNLESYATNVGIAFQIQDDLLGVYGDEQETGKSVLSDIHEGKRTILVAYHEERMNDQQRQRFDEAFGKPTASQESVQRLKDDMSDSGARQQAADLARHYFELAFADLDNLPDDIRKSELQIFTKRLSERNS